jgi:hypothetical protein
MVKQAHQYAKLIAAGKLVIDSPLSPAEQEKMCP